MLGMASASRPIGPLSTFQAVLDVVRAIPSGCTASYADVAELAIGSRRAARTVGWALSGCPEDVPWWRIVRSTGELPGVSDRAQARLLRAEGTVVRRIKRVPSTGNAGATKAVYGVVVSHHRDMRPHMRYTRAALRRHVPERSVADA
jgi:methylated-DNA-protein-cysteine methyltransferase related protein